MSIKVIYVIIFITIFPFSIKGQTSVIDNSTSIGLTNSKVSIKMHKLNGNIHALDANGINLIDKNGAGNFTLYVDVKTDDLWKANPEEENLVRVSSRDMQMQSYHSRSIKNGMQVSIYFDASFEYNDFTYSGISIKQNIKMLNNTNYFSIDYEITNKCKGVTVVSIVACQLGNISKEKNFKLFWPFNEGEIHENVVDKAHFSILETGWDVQPFAITNSENLSVSYPSSMSMQLIQLFNHEEGIYMFIKDKSNEFKKLNFGIFDKRNGYDCDKEKNVSLSTKLYPYIEYGKTKTTAAIVIGIQTEGGWYEGADLYRDWLLSLNPRYNNWPSVVKNFTGMTPLAVKLRDEKPILTYDERISSGVDILTTVEEHNSNGIDNFALLGWHENGFDSMYPDYEFIEEIGGESGFNQGIIKLHNNENKIFGYINIYSGMFESNWYNYKGQGLKATSKKFNGESYVFGPFVSMSPASKEWQEAILKVVDKLARNGIDGLFFDQLMEMPAVLDYDKTHGHSTPATAYGEGFETLLKAVHKKMKEYSNDYLICGEGILDSYVEYVDLALLMWARQMKFTSYSYPEITRYTIPIKMLGIPDKRNLKDNPTEYVSSILMGNPLLDKSNSNPIIKKIVNIYKKYPNIYGRGHYIAARGVKSDDSLLVGIVKTDDKFIISFYNPTSQSVTSNVDFNLEEMSYVNKKVKKIESLLNKNSAIKSNKNKFLLNIEANKIEIFVVELE